MGKIYITGDTHAEFSGFGAKVFDAPAGSIVIICGDFGGVWDNSKREKYWLDWLSEKPYLFLFADGNHENYDLLNTYPISLWNGGNVQFIKENIIHLMRGQIYNIENKSFFVFGGARSHDISAGILSIDDPDFTKKRKKLDRELALYRVDHESWWKEEMPSDEEKEEGLENLRKADFTVDYIISHCAPSSVQDIISGGMFQHDDLTDYLDTIKEKCTFEKWFFGHYHDNINVSDKEILLYEQIIRIA